jgi:hypothetical protein
MNCFNDHDFKDPVSARESWAHAATGIDYPREIKIFPSIAPTRLG